MTSEFDTLFEEWAVPHLQQHLGETGSVIHYPLGDLADPQDLTNLRIVFDEAEDPVRRRDFGVDVQRKPYITVPTSVTVYGSDQWRIAGILFQVLRFDLPKGGQRRIWLVRVETDTHKGGKGVL